MNINILFLVPLIHGFLLEKPQTGQGQTVSTSKCLSVSEFLIEKKLQRENTDSVRHDVEKTLALLNSQLQLKFEALERKVATLEKSNDTNESDQKYQSLEQKYNNLKQENDLLKGKYDMLKYEFSSLNNSNMKMKKELDNVKSLGSIQPLKEIQTLKQDVQSIYAQTQTLSVSEQARRQDFLALYNLTVNSKNALNTIEKTMDNTFISLERNQSVAIKSLENFIINGLQQENKTNMFLQKQIQENSEKVALSACVNYDKVYNTGQIIKFPSVKTRIGINGISSFVAPGKFTCENPGLYFISVQMVANSSSGGRYTIYLNGNNIALPVYVSQVSGLYNAVPKSQVIELKLNEKLWIQVQDGQVEGDIYGSCLTIVKVK